MQLDDRAFRYITHCNLHGATACYTYYVDFVTYLYTPHADIAKHDGDYANVSKHSCVRLARVTNLFCFMKAVYSAIPD